MGTADGETFDSPAVLHPDNQLDLALESEAQGKTLVRPIPNLQLEIELFQFAEVLLQVLVRPPMVPREVVHGRLGQLLFEFVEEATCLLEAALGWPGPATQRHLGLQARIALLMVSIRVIKACSILIVTVVYFAYTGRTR